MSEAQAVEQQAPALRLPELEEAQKWFPWGAGEENFPPNPREVAKNAPEQVRALGSGLCAEATLRQGQFQTLSAGAARAIHVDYEGKKFALKVKDGLDADAVFAALTGWMCCWSPDHYDKEATVIWALWAWCEPPQQYG